MKVCSKCHIEKDESEFWKKKECKNGINSYCKQCASKRKKEYYSANREVLIKKTAEWQQQNKEHHSAWRKEYHIKNREKFITKACKWQKNNKGRRSEICKKWNLNNREYYRDRAKVYFAIPENRKKLQQRGKKYRDEMMDNYIKKLLLADGYTPEEIEKVPSLFYIKKGNILVKRIDKTLKTKQNEKTNDSRNV